MINKVYFPRLVMPLAPALSKLIDFVIAFILLLVLMAWFRSSPTLGVLMLPFLVLMMMVTAVGMGMWLTSMAVQYRDVKYGINFLVQLLMYAAPVVYPASLIPDRYRLIYALNPMVGVVEGFRSALLGTNPMPWDLLGVGGAVALGFALTGMLYFRRTERIFADVA
jgi:lipopolysaccharide transport system permease protein